MTSSADNALNHTPPAKIGHSYGQILRSSTIVGGSQGFSYLVGMLRTKLVAVLIGPSGVGLVALYTSATELVGTLTGMGINTSGVREVAEAHGSGKADQIARTVKTLRRACWATGILGWIVCAALSFPLSLYTFGSDDRAWLIAILGATILINSLSGGQSALIQGTRRIGDLARMGMFAALAGTIVAVCIYAWLGQKGIVPVLIVSAIVNLGFSTWVSRRIPVAPVSLSWQETFKHSKQLIHIGVAFMYGAILFSAVGLTIRSMLVKHSGLDVNGLFQAAWGVSGMFSSFILNAMGTDFYPRLTAVAHDNEHVNRLVNEQTEIGILLALPGLLATLVFAPTIMHIFYSAEFLPGAPLLPWLLVGSFASVIKFPMGFIQRAKGAVGWIYIGQTLANVPYLLVAMLLIPQMNVAGVAYAYAISSLFHGLTVYLIARQLSQFAWTRSAARLIVSAFCLILVGLILQKLPGKLMPLICGTILTGIACVTSLRGIASRLGSDHRVVRMACRLPGGRFTCGLKRNN